MAIYANISIDQGSDFSTEVVVSDSAGNAADLTGYLVTGQLRKTYTSSTAVSFVCTITSAINGTISLALSNSTTNDLKAGRYVYDVEIQNGAGGDISRVIEGQVTVNPGVTR
jgi:hypothetical protein